VVDRAFQAVGVEQVFIDLASTRGLREGAYSSPPQNFALDPVTLRSLLDEKKLVVYSVNEKQFRNITSQWASSFLARHPRKPPHRVQPGLAADALLSQGWHPSEGTYRWMARRATVELGFPQAGGSELMVRGYFPENQAAGGPVRLTASAGGRRLGEVVISKAGAPYEATFALPRDWGNSEAVPVVLEVDRTFRVLSDPRELGLVVDLIEIR
jgi:hypothetical protein